MYHPLRSCFVTALKCERTRYHRASRIRERKSSNGYHIGLSVLLNFIFSSLLVNFIFLLFGPFSLVSPLLRFRVFHFSRHLTIHLSHISHLSSIASQTTTMANNSPTADIVNLEEQPPVRESRQEGVQSEETADGPSPAEEENDARAGGPRLGDDEKVALVRAALRHFDVYRNGTRAEFKAKVGETVLTENGVDVKHPDRALNKLVAKRRSGKKKKRNATGVAVSTTDFDQSLDQWIELIDDVQQLADEAKKPRMRRTGKRRKSPRLRDTI